MERQRQETGSQSNRPSHSGVHRVATLGVLAELGRELRIAKERAGALRQNIDQRGKARSVDDLSREALQELDTAHEELRVTEETLYAQADAIFAAREKVDIERRRYRELFDSAPEAYFITDLHGVVIEANRKASALLNLEPAFVPSKPLVSFIALADRCKFRGLLDGLTEAPLEVDLRCQPRKGQPAWVSITVQRATGADGRPSELRWLMRSIVRKKEEEQRRSDDAQTTEQQLNDRVHELEGVKRLLEHLLEREQEARKEAEAAIQHKDRVLTEVAHELRNPLGSIAGWLRILTEDRAEQGLRRRALMSMTRGVRALARLLEELIEHARFEQYKISLDVSTLNLVRVGVEVIEDLRPLAALKNIHIGFSAHPHEIQIHGDPWRLQQVFRNLISNAIKFTPEDGAIKVTVGVAVHETEIAITDTGRGLTAEALNTIFQPFAQVTTPGSRVRGLGLGLSISQRLVELHGGTVRAESDGLDHGSTFRVRLPLLAAPD